MRGSSFFSFCFFTLFSFCSLATHIVGGEIFYDSLGNNQYKITIEVYRDCNSTTTFDNPLNYTVFNSNGSIFSQFSVDFVSVSPLLPIPDPCIIVPPGVCIEKAIYIDTITLPFNALGYTISYQRCCWATDILNLTLPSDNGLTITTYIPGSSMVNVPNNSARFNNLPPLVLCSNRTITFDHSATDPDGDSLVYLITPSFEGGNSASPVPDPETPPPYAPVGWMPGYSDLQQFGPGSSMTINSSTGLINYTPSILGEFVTGVGVKEYRNGILINAEIRTFAFTVVQCDSIIPFNIASIGDTNIIEGCGNTNINISRTDSSTAITFHVIIGGSAINGTDYNLINDSITMPIDIGSVSIPIGTIVDNIPEGSETITFQITYLNICNNFVDTVNFHLQISDYKSMEIIQKDTLLVCSDFGETALLTAKVLYGKPAYSYYWAPGTNLNNDSLLIPSTLFIPGVNHYFLTVSDECNQNVTKHSIVINQCPLIAPNVITSNGDGKNDFFIIQNLEDYDAVNVIIVNRWGNLVYQNSHYKNEWEGKDMNGNKLADGTYFYTATPSSEKYTYSEKEKTQYTARGFVQIIE